MRHRHAARGGGLSLLAVLAAGLPVEASANAIIPYMAVPWGQAFLLPLVVAVEGVALWRFLGGRFPPALGQSFVANVVSTLVGAAVYFAAMPLFGQTLFDWWFKGVFATEAVRNLLIAVAFAVVLFIVSWLLESAVVARLRKAGSWRAVARQCAIANLITYVALISLAVSFQR